MARMVIRLLDRIEPEQRRLWAARLLVWSVIGWLLSHVLLTILPPWFFQHVILAISWIAIIATAADVIQTSDVRAEQ